MASATSAPKVDVSPEPGKWYPQRSDLCYTFIATIEVVDANSGKQIVSATSSLSRYGCHVRTTTPFLPGTSVKMTIKHQSIAFQCGGEVVYAISGEGMGVHFEKVGIAERVILKEWLLQVGNQELEHRLRKRVKTPIPLSKQEIVLLIGCVVVLAAIMVGAFAWFGTL
jgi:hypothetical protein